jgi:ribonuclease BN (tRNA processing enzyme)
MVEVVFLGVGEAFDETLPNTSILIRCGREAPSITLLLDCGFTAPPQFWKEEPAPDALDGVWISHFHGDHAFGLPALLVRFWREGRRKGLTLLGPRGIESFTRRVVGLAYPGFYRKLTFPLEFVEVEPRGEVTFSDLTFRTAENTHSLRDLALRIEGRGTSIYYSGDGKPTPESTALAQGIQLIIHEAFHMKTELAEHGTVTGSVDMAKRCSATHLAILHIHRGDRTEVLRREKEIGELAGPVNLIVPHPGHRLVLEPA